MDMLKTLFPDSATLRRYVSGFQAGNSIDELTGVMPSAEKQLAAVLPAPLLARVVEADETSTEGKYIRSALANLLMMKYIAFDSVEKRITGKADMYKYEVEAIRRQYADNFYSAMDSLLEVVSTSAKYEVEWKGSRWARLLAEVPIRTCADFDDIYPIDLSYHFFFRTLPFQREAYLEYSQLFAKLRAAEEKDPTEINFPELNGQLRLAFAKIVVSLALLRFDVSELPLNIRNLFSEQKSPRGTNDLSASVRELAARLRAEAETSFSAVVAALSDSRPVGSSGICANESDKIVLLA